MTAGEQPRGRAAGRGGGTRAAGRKAQDGRPIATCDCGSFASHKVWCAVRSAARGRKAALDRAAAAARPPTPKQEEQRRREILGKKKDAAAWLYARHATKHMAIARHRHKKATASGSAPEESAAAGEGGEP